MGHFTAYYASELGRRVSLLEQGRVGDPATASYGRTRFYSRNDCLDPIYVRRARSSRSRSARSSACPRCAVRERQPERTYDGHDYVEACRVLADKGAALAA